LFDWRYELKPDAGVSLRRSLWRLIRRFGKTNTLGRRAGRLIGPVLMGAFALTLITSIAVVGRTLKSATTVVASPATAVSALSDYGGAQILDRNGELLYRYPDRDGGIRIPLHLDHVSGRMIDATVSTEDAGFWTNGGLDPLSTLRAAASNTVANGSPFVGGGGSGITQQLVKLTLISADQRDAQSVSRKIAEALLAIGLTHTYSKSQILEWYFNAVNYGGSYDGIESAAQGYFGIHASDLDLAQSALLAGIPQSPAAYSPYTNPEGAKARQGEVLDLMIRHHDITQAQADAARSEALNYQAPKQSLEMRAPWFVEYVRQRLVDDFGERCFEICGLQVQTSLDINLEDRASQILDTNITQWGDPVGAHDGAIVSIDARTGEILVMVGSRNYDDGSQPIQGQNNFATAISQPGSSFKPFVYLALFKQRGYGPDSIIWDAPYSTSDGYHCQDPVQGGRTQGPIPVRLALGSSLNCAANRAAQVAGIQNVLDTAHSMGIASMDDAGSYGAAIATGGANVTLLDMAYAYTTMDRNGNLIGARGSEQRSNADRKLDPVALLDVRDGRGQVLYHYAPQTEQVVPAGYPYLVTSILSDCANRRLIWQCGFPEFTLPDGRPVAVKTGTQQGADIGHTIANWQYMYTPQIVTGGWVGNADRSAWTDINGGANAVGYSVQQLEQQITDSYQISAQDFERPPDLVTASVHVPDGSRGQLAGCGPIEEALFVQGTAPDVNNRVCQQGRIGIPDDQAGTGGLVGDSPGPARTGVYSPSTAVAIPAPRPPAAPRPSSPKPQPAGRRGH
jgi:membrane peptidoglycan carboxypeptidase